MRSSRALRAASAALLASVIFVGYQCANGDDKPPGSFQERVDRFARPLIDKKDGIVGLVVGIMTPDGRREFHCYGTTKAGGPPPAKDTLFEIGSVTKVFTTLLLAQMVESKALALDEPAQRSLPKDMVVPRRGAREITLEELATHTSGLPSIPPNLLRSMIALRLFHQMMYGTDAGENPYAKFDAAQLQSGLAEIRLAAQAKPPAAYSNFGMGLLGFCLAQKSGMKFEDLVRTRIATPLGMSDTVQHPSPSQRKRMAVGHRKKWETASRWTFDCLAGCGALCSTADDLLRFLDAESGRAKSPLSSAMEMTQVKRRSLSSAAGIGLGWHMFDLEGECRVWLHNGGTNGFTSFVAFTRTPPAAVVVLCNTGPDSDAHKIDGFAMRFIQEIAKSNAKRQK